MTSAAHSVNTNYTVLHDSRGIVYVEFVFAFMPLLVLFLSICQVAFLTMGRLVVQHAALCGARTAIVVLEDDPKKYADIARGNLTDGAPLGGLEELLASLGLARLQAAVDDADASGLFGAKEADRSDEQRGARMTPIRAAATMPLLLLAPNEAAVGIVGAESVAASLPGNFVSRLPFALEYTRTAGVITVHAASGSEELIAEPVARTAPVMVRVTYLMPCGLPLARMLMCRTLDSLLKSSGSAPNVLGVLGSEPSSFARRLSHAQGIAALKHMVSPTARFVVLTAETTLPNQGAGYDHPGEP